MRIFELLNPQQQQPLPGQTGPDQEDDAQGKFDADKVDSNLKSVAQDVDNTKVQPEPQAPQQPPELDDQNTKPIDSALLSQIKPLAYSKKYDFGENDQENPMRVAAMSVQDLTKTQSDLRWKMQQLTMKVQVGMDDDKDMEFYSDLNHFINVVLHFKKSNTPAQLAAMNPSPPYQTHQRSK